MPDPIAEAWGELLQGPTSNEAWDLAVHVLVAEYLRLTADNARLRTDISALQAELAELADMYDSLVRS